MKDHNLYISDFCSNRANNKNLGIYFYNTTVLYSLEVEDKVKSYKFILCAAKSKEDFISNVEKGRGDKLLKPRSEWGTGKTYFADEALSIGLIDAIDTFDNVVNYFSNF